jgi:hypothetical protein
MSLSTVLVWSIAILSVKANNLLFKKGKVVVERFSSYFHLKGV